MCSKADYRGMKLLITMKPIKSKSWCSNCSKNTKIGCLGSTSGPESPVKVNSPKLKICKKKFSPPIRSREKNLRTKFKFGHTFQAHSRIILNKSQYSNKCTSFQKSAASQCMIHTFCYTDLMHFLQVSTLLLLWNQVGIILKTQTYES